MHRRGYLDDLERPRCIGSVSDFRGCTTPRSGDVIQANLETRLDEKYVLAAEGPRVRPRRAVGPAHGDLPRSRALQPCSDVIHTYSLSSSFTREAMLAQPVVQRTANLRDPLSRFSQPFQPRSGGRQFIDGFGIVKR